MTTPLDYSLMAGSSYRTTRTLENLFPTPPGWTLFFPVPDPSTAAIFPVSAGFEAVAFQKGSEIVISYAGTYTKQSADLQAGANLVLGLGSAQLNQAIEYYLQIKIANPGAVITLTGHSLGGGLAALVGVFFGVSATVFDEAPFAQTALFQAQNLKAYLVGKLDAQGGRLYGDTLLAPLTDYIAQNEAFGASPTLIPNVNLISNIAVQGEFLSGWVGHIATTIDSIANTSPGASATDDLHSMALLSAFLQSRNTAATGQRLNEVTVKLPDLVKMIFDTKLFGFASDDADNRSLIDNLVRHESGVRHPVSGVTQIAADAMVTRFTKDLWKLAQDGGLTMTDRITGFPDLRELSKTLVAFAMQFYYENSANATDQTKYLLSDVTGGIRFDMADVSKDFATATANNTKPDLAKIKGLDYAFKTYLAGSTFTSAERTLIQSMLPHLRDWYVQAGTNGLAETDTLDRGAFMLGGTASDALVGGSKADLLVGNAGDDVLQGRGGNDLLLGGTGNDTYIYSSTNGGDGLDTILDRDGNGSILYNSQTLAGGAQYGGDKVHRDAQGRVYTEVGGGRLVIDGNIVVEGWSAGKLGINMAGPAVTVPVDNYLSGTSQSDTLTGTGGSDQIEAYDGSDILVGGAGNDRMYADAQAADADAIAIGNASIGFASRGDWLTGGGGDDTMVGSAASDVLMGGGGKDLLIGGAGDDDIWGDGDWTAAGYSWTVYWETVGQNQTRTYTGTTGIGLLRPLDSGPDLIYAGSGDDVVFAGSGNNVLFGEDGNDALFGDFDYGEALQGNDVMLGGRGNDSLSSSYGDDYLDGGADHDGLFAGRGDDILIGGTGNDYLHGEQGQDTYIYNLGDGNDHIIDSAGEKNILWFGAGVNPSSITLRLGSLLLDLGNGDQVHIDNFNPDDVYNSSSIDSFEFADGTTLNVRELLERGFDIVGTELADVLEGTNVTDRIEGLGGDDVVYGLAGNDQLAGGGGNDVLAGDDLEMQLTGQYHGDDLLDGGDGNDQLFGLGGNDTLLGGSGDDLMRGDSAGAGLDVALQWQGNDIMDGGAGADAMYGDDGNDSISGGADGDQLNGGGGADFLDGGAGVDTLQGGYGNDQLVGGDGNDTLDGGEGDDSLNGGAGDDSLLGHFGNDTYLFGLGDGIDTISTAEMNTNPGSGTKLNTLQFKAGINPSDVILTRNLSSITNDLVVTFQGHADAVIVKSFFQSIGYSGGYPYLAAFDAFNEVQQMVFDNGVVWDQAFLLDSFFGGTAGNDTLTATEYGGPLHGKAGDDTIYGGDGVDALSGDDGADALYGYGGDDALYGGMGEDHLDGGSGNDLLEGGADNDTLWGALGANTFVFGRGDGTDTIWLYNNYEQWLVHGWDNTLKFEQGVTASDLVFRRNEDNYQHNLEISIAGTADKVIVQEYFGWATGPDSQYNPLQHIEFADGSIWGYAEMEAKFLADNPGIHGTSDYDLLIGGASDDKMFGYDGDDLLDGGGGADEMWGGHLNDVYVVDNPNDLVFELLDDGLDSVVASTSFTLSANVEQLSLVGTDAIDGIGNDLDNLMEGNNAANILTGGAGNDTLRGNGGADIFAFSSGWGLDVIEQTGADPAASADYISFGANVATADLVLTNTLDHLRIANTVTGDAIEIQNFFNVLGEENGGVEAIHFSDGTVWSRNSVVQALKTVTGTSGNDRLYAIKAGASLYGLGGVDELYGGVGNDSLYGGDGIDYLYGSAGMDVLDGGTAADILVGGTGDDSLNGGADADEMYAEEGNDVLDGGLGNDVMVGWAGSDTYVVNSSGDVVNEFDEYEGGNLNLDTGVDLVLASISYTLGQNVENLTLTGSSAVAGTGNGLDNVLTGNTGINVLTGGAGNDTYVVGTGDTTIEVAGGGTDTVQSSITWTLATELENLTLTGASAINGTGNTLANVLSGNSGANTLTGLAGDDTYLYGLGGGADRVVDSAGNDRIVFGAGITSGQITATRTGSVIKLALNASDSISIDDLGGGLFAVEQFEFADASVLGAAWLNSILPSAAPTATNLSASEAYTEDTARNLVDMVVTDTDSANVTVTLTLSNIAAGSLNAGTSGAVTSTYTAGTGVWSASGAKASVNTLLAALTFTPTANFNGNFTVATSVSDGVNPAVTGSKTFTGTKVNDASTGTVTISGIAAQGQTLTAAHTLADVDGLGAIAYQWKAAGVNIAGATASSFALTSTQVGKAITVSASFTDGGGTAESKTSAATASVITSVTGTSAANTLNGSTGAELMIGLAGNDTYVVNNAGDLVLENLNEGTDLVNASVSHTLGVNVENITLTGSSAINATGNALDNVLTGNSGANVLTGGAGNDTYVAGTGDTTIEAANAGIDTVQSSITRTLAANVENLTLTGTSAINGTGNTDHNVLIGNSGVNTLTGNAGNDTLDGKAGADSLIGGTGNDTYWLGRGYGIDAITETDATAGNTDIARFESSVATDQLWFRQVSNNLEVSIIGTSDKFNIVNWYTGAANHVEQFKTSDGKTLLDSQVQNLVSAMAAFAPPAAGQTTLPANYATALAPVLAANWV